MRNPYARILLCVACCNAFLAIAASAQKHPSKADDWPLQNASIGPVEIAAGTSRQMQAMYPTRMARRFRCKQASPGPLNRQ